MGNATNDLGTLTTEAARFAHARIKQLSTEVQELEHENDVLVACMRLAAADLLTASEQRDWGAVLDVITGLNNVETRETAVSLYVAE